MPRSLRRAVPLTPLIDVIFLLLLFFMLTTTFTRTGEIPLAAAGAGGDGLPPLFLRVAPDSLTLNGTAITPEALAQGLQAGKDPARVLVSLAEGVQAQRLADVLHLLRKVPEATVQVLGN
jgi:biopolymer transport protein ExbD